MSTEEGAENTVGEVQESRSACEEALTDVCIQQADEELLQEQVGKIMKLAAESLSETGRILLSDAKKRSAVIVQDAERQAEAILAVAVEETKKWEAEKQAISKAQHFDPTEKVKLNIGSMRFETSLTTLRRFPDSMIGCTFSGRHALPKGEDGYFFIDRDGTHFRHILNFLRSPESYKPGLTGAEQAELLGECKYYGIDQLMFPSDPSHPSYEPMYPDTLSSDATISLPYLELPRAGQAPQGSIAVLADGAGVLTIGDSGEEIEFCRNCLRGIFRIEDTQYFFKDFNGQSLPEQQPNVQGKCPICGNNALSGIYIHSSV
jgi:hypothetical protein